MFIYTAMLTARPGQQQPAMAQIVEARQIVEGATGRPTSAWAGLTGEQLGTFAISTTVESVAELADGHAKLGASVEYAALSGASGEIWSAPAATTFSRVVGSVGESDRPGFITLTTTTIEGSFSDALAFGHEVMEYVFGAIGGAAMLLLSESPHIGQMTWVHANETVEQASANDAKLQQDQGYLSLYDRAGDLFVPGTTRRSSALRLG